MQPNYFVKHPDGSYSEAVPQPILLSQVQGGATLIKEAVARVCHEVNRAYCQALGDNSQPSWEDAPDWMKSSAANGVSLHLDNPNAGPEASHKSWMAEKEATGWKFGPVKDAEKKEHPCMVPFDELPKEQQAKDFIFRAVIHSLASI